MTVPIRNPRDRHFIVTVTVTKETAKVSGYLADVTIMTLVTVICGRILTPVLIDPGAGCLRFEGKDQKAKRDVATLICDSDFEPIAVGS